MTRWRCVPGADDLIWFEGGGDDAHIRGRISDPGWHSVLSSTTTTARLFSRKRATERSHQPLTTVYYLFNTLDVEVTRSPRMEKMWTNVEALYVHGLMIHRSTGRGLSHSAIPNPCSSPTTTPSDTGLGMGLRRVYVLVGSWHGKAGVKHVDFIKKARARLRACETEDTTATASFSLMNNPTSQLHDPTSVIEHDPASNLMPAPSLPYIQTCQIPSLPSFTTSNLLLPSSSAENIPSSELNSEHNDNVITVNQHHRRQRRPSLDSLCSAISSSSSISSHGDICASSSPSAHDFHIRIPQIAWSDKLNNGKGGYYISRTVEDCQRLVHGQHLRPAEDDPQEPDAGSVPTYEKSVSHRLWNLKLFATRSAIELERRVEKPTRPSYARRRPPKLQLDRSKQAAAIKKTQQHARSPFSTSQSWSQASLEYYAHENLSQTIFSPTSTIFIPPSSATTTTTLNIPHRAQQPWSSPASSCFMFDTEPEPEGDNDLNVNLNARSPWTRFREKLVIFRQFPLSSVSKQMNSANDVPQHSRKGELAR